MNVPIILPDHHPLALGACVLTLPPGDRCLSEVFVAEVLPHGLYVVEDVDGVRWKAGREELIVSEA